MTLLKTNSQCSKETKKDKKYDIITMHLKTFCWLLIRLINFNLKTTVFHSLVTKKNLVCTGVCVKECRRDFAVHT